MFRLRKGLVSIKCKVMRRIDKIVPAVKSFFSRFSREKMVETQQGLESTISTLQTLLDGFNGIPTQG